MLFDSWAGIGRVLVVGTLAYVLLIFILRVTGKRTLSKMNAFDLIVTVALGSALASTMLSKSVPLAEGVLGFTLLIVLQYAVTWLSVRSEGFQNLVKAQPRLLVHRGQWMPDAMRRERVTEEEVLAALRTQGIPAIDEMTTLVLETEGSLSILTSAAPDKGMSSLAPVALDASDERPPAARVVAAEQPVGFR
jgi:uncharacterized membrane protein YcaP (DUF421 family)